HEFIGMRQMKGENNGQSMQQEGMLSFVRHPLYSGSILAILGYLIFAPSLTNLIMGMILVLYFITGIYFEEKKLVIEFGEKYIRYKGQVPALLPSWKKIFRQHKNPKKK
ncbi:MAG: isoprenylcysteine carboxylmethyltransferase family protein, partial [Cyclobacteriaceae bacterium]|nr:isoprenylcysteine carboxylmethyltransferase family protein [Cyclobacteriaceae bacterium]